MTSLLLALALAQPSPAPAPEPPPTPAPPVPVTGLADLHLHQWAELAYAGRWYFGDAAGPAPMALGECGEVMERPRVPRRVQHGVILPVHGPLEPIARALAFRAAQDERSDDLRPKHPPMSISTAGSLPHWLGWPSSDSIAHQQAWEGWLRLAHDGVPLLWWLDQLDEAGEAVPVEEALDRFYADYRTHMNDAARAGAVGLNLAVVSLVHNNLLCRQQVHRKARRDNPSACNDMDSIHRQYRAAVAWVDHHDDWVALVTTPEQAADAVREGKLALMLSLEASDVFGPSETIGDDSPFADGYIGRAAYLQARDPALSRDEAVTLALSEYLDALPMVATVQLTHQYDSPFAGAAFITSTFVKQQRWRDRHPHQVTIDGVRHRCRDAAVAWKFEAPGEVSAYPQCQAALSTDHTGSPSASGIFRLFENAPPAHALPRDYRRRSPTRPYTNAYGLSHDGTLLVGLLAQRGLLLDTSHLSRAALADLRDQFPDLPTYSSHAYPQASDLLTREQNLAADDLAHVDLVGVRPGDDEATPVGAPADDPFAALLRTADCQNTSVATGLHLSTVARSGPLVAYGTDLNGFINQPMGTATLRPPLYGGAPCATAVPPIGSEVAHRGLAHIGLLPQLHLETVATAGQVQPDGATRGVEHLLSLWRRARCQAGLPDDCTDEVPSATVPWTDWRDWLYDDDGGLATVPVTLPSTRPRQAGRPFDTVSTGSVARAPQPEGTPLPRLRALEATVPYRSDDPEGSLVVAQLPTRLGFLVGAYSVPATRAPWHFPVTRCKRSGWHGLTEAGDRAAQRARCEPLAQARRNHRRGMRRRTDTHPMFRTWDRLYPGPLDDPDEARSLSHRHGLLLDDGQTAWHDWPTFALTVTLLRDDDDRCLQADGLLDAPPVGLPAGQAPVDWLLDAKGRAKTCYCTLLERADDAGLTIARDEAALTLCRSPLNPAGVPR